MRIFPGQVEEQAFCGFTQFTSLAIYILTSINIGEDLNACICFGERLTVAVVFFALYYDNDDYSDNLIVDFLKVQEKMQYSND